MYSLKKNEVFQRRKDKHLFLNVQIFWRKYFVEAQKQLFFCKQTLTNAQNYNYFVKLS